MAKIDLIELRQIIGREEFDYPLLTSALSPYLAVDQKINELLKSGAVVRVKKGLYVFGSKTQQKAICQESLANLIYGPSCISMEYALSYHGLIPERVETITSVTPKKNKEFNTPVGRFTYRHLSPAKYPHGIGQIWIDQQHPILMATPEKALCDYVVLRNVPEITSPKAAKDFLMSDLRIDLEDWSRLDVRKLLRLNKAYNSRTIACILEVL